MNTELSDITDNTYRGSIFFDSHCSFCVDGRNRWGRIFESRGWIWVPMQTPGTAKKLGITEEMLMAEMWVQPAGGGARPLSGVDSWHALMRSVWWLSPLGFVITLPGLKPLAQTIYRWIARNRYCFAGKCQLPTPAQNSKPSTRHRHAAFLEFP